MKVICISGKARHGKDTVGSMMSEFLEDGGNKTLIAHYGDLVKYVCKTFFGWNGDKDDYGRTLLQRVGTDIIREQVPDYWVKFICDMLCFFPNEWDYVLIPDCRFPNEIEYLKQRKEFNTVSIRVNRKGFVSNLSKSQLMHPSEIALDNYCFDYFIHNEDMDTLKKDVKTVVGLVERGC